MMKIILIFFLINTMQVNAELDFGYHNYLAITNTLKSYQKNFPNQAYLYSIGKSVENRELWVMALAESHPNVHLKLRPEAKYVGNMHGNEGPTQEVLLHLIDYMLNNQKNDTNIAFLMKNVRVHILVSMNPDGFEKSLIGSCSSKVGRNNSNGLDLNRNFPDMYYCNKAELQPETDAVINWFDSNNFILSGSFHTGAVVASYPFDNFINSHQYGHGLANPTDDIDLFRNLALKYSLNNLIMPKAICDNETFVDGVTNGASWFPPVTGGMCDFNYWRYGISEVTLEILCCLNPPAAELKTIWQQNKDALIELLKMANTGVRGIIKYTNGQPAKHLSVKIDSREPAFKTNKDGEYYRMLLPGSYELSLMLNCDQIYKNTILIPKSGLLELNIEIDSQYQVRAQSYRLDRYALFCNKAKAPIECPKQTVFRKKANKNGSANISSSLALLFLLALATLVK